MNTRPEEISNVIKEQIKNYRSKIEMKETGTVILVGDGIARVFGLRDCMSSELLEFEDGSFGMAQNLEAETVSVALLSNTNNIKEGSSVKRTVQEKEQSEIEGMSLCNKCGAKKEGEK